MATSHRLPAWAPRVARREIRRLYDTDAQGIYDGELIDRVGYALLARCESFITAVRAREGELPCPVCGERVRRSTESGTDEILRCPCGWELPWADYFETIQHKQLCGAKEVVEQFEDFVRRFPAARTAQERMLSIDRLIHGFHYYLKTGHPTRPVAVNLIEGKMRQVVAFLDRLTYGPQSTPGVDANRAEWHDNLAVNAEWYPSVCDTDSSSR